MELVSRKELLKEYEVEASFYNVRIEGETFECRSQARIKRKGVQVDKADAILILCNPGSCDPDVSEKVPELDLRKDFVPFIKANSDQTQEQIMRLMKFKQWSLVNIINLSDICAGNLQDFKSKYNKVKQYSFSYHSIFSDTRKNEIKTIIDSNEGRIILGWGEESHLKEMANEALQHKLINNFISWKHAKNPFYYHPNPYDTKLKKQWLRIIVNLLD